MSETATLSGNWHYPTRVWFGAGRIRELPAACAELGMHRPLLVTDPGLAALPMLSDALRACREAGLPCELFSDVRGNPVLDNVEAGLAIHREGNHDGIIAFGGGSAMDAAKAIALMVGQHRPLWDFEDREDWWTRADPAGIAPIVAVPTTAGTGSEVGRAAVITDPADHTKKVIFHPKMLPGIVIADPGLTVGLPPTVTAATGMDALSHNLEAFLSPVFHPMADGIAVEGIRLIHRWLPAAHAEGDSLTARAHMLVASSMGATAFQKGLGAMHSLSHPCGAVLDTHHGLTNAVVMPYVLAFNGPAVEEKLARLARLLDLPGQGPRAVLEWVLALRGQLGIPHTLADLGVTDGHVARLAAMAVVDPTAPTNPVPLTVENLGGLYHQAIHGELAV